MNEKITFQVATVNEVEQSNKGLLKNKAAGGNIPLKVLKQSSKFCFEELRYCINYAVSHGKFLDSLKIANGTHVHKKDDPTDKTNLHLSTKKICPTDKTNFRAVCVLPLPSKLFEKLMYDQLNKYMIRYLNKLLCNFRQAHST